MFRKNIVNNKGIYILAISGGPDSIFLLWKLRKNKNIVAAHVNYNKRIDSCKDQKIVEDFCIKNNIVFEKLSLTKEDYIPFEKGNRNFQSIAREIRYNFFLKLCKKYNTSKIVTAHHFNDKIETYVMQKKRRSNPINFGIVKKTKYKWATLLRPLLEFWKKDILKILDKKNIDYALDSSNNKNIYIRNIIRNELKDLKVKEIKNIDKNCKKDNRKLRKIKKKYEKKLEIKISEYSQYSFFWKKYIIYFLLINSGIKTYEFRGKRIFEIVRRLDSNRNKIFINFPDFTIYKEDSVIRVSLK